MNMRATASPLAAGTLKVADGEFHIEDSATCGWDYLAVDGVKFCEVVTPSVVEESWLKVENASGDE